MIFRFIRIRYITFHFPVISFFVLSESIISVSTFVLSDSVISNSKSVISDLYYLFPFYQSPLYQIHCGQIKVGPRLCELAHRGQRESGGKNRATSGPPCTRHMLFKRPVCFFLGYYTRYIQAIEVI